jgi:hypothetical protein
LISITNLSGVVRLRESSVTSGPVALDASVTVTADVSFAGARLAIIGLLPEDRLSVSVSSGPGQISISGNTVTFGGTPIGTLQGGVGSTLTITFNASASEELAGEGFD